MTDSQGPVLSVRGQAHASVSPDSARVFGSFELVNESKALALAAAGQLSGQLAADLVALGAVAQRAGTERIPLTWSTRKVGTRPETLHNYQTRQHPLRWRTEPASSRPRAVG